MKTKIDPDFLNLLDREGFQSVVCEHGIRTIFQRSFPSGHEFPSTIYRREGVIIYNSKPDVFLPYVCWETNDPDEVFHHGICEITLNLNVTHLSLAFLWIENQEISDSYLKLRRECFDEN